MEKCNSCLDSLICDECLYGYYLLSNKTACVSFCPTGSNKVIGQYLSSTTSLSSYRCLNCIPYCYDCLNGFICNSCF